jgi:single-stranded DNA-binding protein
VRGINSLFLLGTLRGEPEQLTSKSGKNYIRFEMDVVTLRKANGIDEEVREVVPVIAFGKLGEIVRKYIGLKDPLHVVAHISSNEFTANAGAVRRSVSVVADSLQLISNGRKEEGRS